MAMKGSVMRKPSGFIFKELKDAFNAGLQEAAGIAGGWTGPENTPEHARVVSAVCRAIRREILKAELKGGTR
jgi:hypothetical protein